MNKKYLPLLSPIYWPGWLGIGLLWLITRLPFHWQIKLGRLLGRAFYYLPTKLKRITETNIKLCYPNYTEEQRTTLIKKNFESIGIGIIEAGMAWWLPATKLTLLVKIHGLPHIDAALAKGKGIILVGPHFTCLEMINRLLGMQYTFAVMYRPHKKLMVSYIHERFRNKESVQFVQRHRMRDLLRVLNNNRPIWYAYDVDGGKKRTVFAPFFGIPTASLTTVTRIVKLSGAAVIPISFYRREDNQKLGYDIFLGSPLQNFPGESLMADATRLNETVEHSIRLKPEQYVWQYKRFKTRPQGEKRIY